jgi:hypothetical protein
MAVQPKKIDRPSSQSGQFFGKRFPSFAPQVFSVDFGIPRRRRSYERKIFIFFCAFRYSQGGQNLLPKL